MRITTATENRKDVVKAMEIILNERARYLGPPSFAYRIGKFSIDRDGNVETDSEEEGASMENELTQRGLLGGEQETLSIELPFEGMTVDSLKNLIYMIHSKQYLLEKAVGHRSLWVSDALTDSLGAEELTLEDAIKMIEEAGTVGLAFNEERIRFTEFPLNGDESKVYVQLTAQMVKAAKEQKRISPQETKEANEKYYMRIWLVRLGFGGKEGKEVRKALLARLKGHTAFRTEADKEKWMAKNSKRAKEVDADE